MDAGQSPWIVALIIFLPIDSTILSVRVLWRHHFNSGGYQMLDSVIELVHSELVAYFGMIMILSAFLLETRDILHSKERPYLILMSFGSGLLAVAAVKLGARLAIGIDRDADALRSAQQCVTENHVSGRVELLKGDLVTLSSTAPVVTANLTGATLTRLAPTIRSRVTPGGHLILSGILASEVDTVVRSYATGAELVWQAFEEEWVGLMVRVGTQS